MLLNRKNLYGNSIIIRAFCFVFCFNCIIGLKTFRYISRNKIHWEGSKSSHYSQEKLGWQAVPEERDTQKRLTAEPEQRECLESSDLWAQQEEMPAWWLLLQAHRWEAGKARRLSTRHMVAWVHSPLSFPPPAAKSPGPSAYCVDFIILILKTLNVCRQICPG